MGILNNEIEQLFDSVFSNEQTERVEQNEEFNNSFSAELFSLITEDNTPFDSIETSASISVSDYLFSKKNILKIINE